MTPAILGTSNGFTLGGDSGATLGTRTKTSQPFDVRDEDLDDQLTRAESNVATLGTIVERQVVDEGQNHIRVIWHLA